MDETGEENVCAYCCGDLEPMGEGPLKQSFAWRCLDCHSWAFVDLAGNQWEEPPELPPEYEGGLA